MLNYLELNVNPKKRKTGDCSTRALVSCIGIDYNTALDLQVQEAKKSYYDITSRQVTEKVLEKFGYYKMKQPRKDDNTKYKVKEMDQVLTNKDLQNRVIVNVAHHYVTLRDSNYIDIWDSGNRCVGNYFVKVK